MLHCRIVIVALVALTGLGCLQSIGAGADQGPTIIVYGYSALEQPFVNAVIPAFRRHYRQLTGQQVNVITSFAGSGTIFNQIRFGAPAQVAIFATEVEAQRLAQEGFIRTNWRTFPQGGTPAYTSAVLVARRGNPMAISAFQDLARPGLKVLLPDPVTSGGAQWGLLALFGSLSLHTELADSEILAIVKQVRDNAVSLADSARQAQMQFALGYGDVLLSYENDALTDIARGHDYTLIVPPSTILIEPKAVIIDANVSKRERQVVEAFLQFLWSREAQASLASYHFRVTDDQIAQQYGTKFAPIDRPFTIQDLGGWEWATENVIKGAWQRGAMATGRR